MTTQLPEHALVIFLGQSLRTPGFRTAERCLKTSPQSSRWLSTSSQTRPVRAPSSLHTTQRQFHTQTRHRPLQTNNLSSRQINLAGSHFRPRHLSHAQQQRRVHGGAQQQTGRLRIAILGGGITGLSNAHYLAKWLPQAKITIYAGSDRLGGWLDSKQVNVGNGKIVFEQGPRTLRSKTVASLVTAELIQDLNLEKKLIVTPHTADAARNRFIYYPDHLVKMPGPGQGFFNMAWSLLREPIYEGLFKSLSTEINTQPRPADMKDESIGQFLQRRTGSPDIADNIVSAILHGIYAGDIYQLSMKSLLPRFWHNERADGSLSATLWKSLTDSRRIAEYRDLQLQQDIAPKLNTSLVQLLQNTSVYTFEGGISTLSHALEKSLRANPNVEFRIGDKVKGLEYDAGSDGILVRTARNYPPIKYTNCVSTIPASALSALTPSVPSLAGIHAVTVMVVNLYYKSPTLLREDGFGYLIPRSVSLSQNPERALGVVFDSCSSLGQDSVSGTKLTVMLGGHWWDCFSGAYPDEEEGLAMAKSVVHRHLGIDIAPDATQVGIKKDCIPQYVVGHEERLGKAHSELLTAFNGKLSVAGNSYTGVGVNDCVRAARGVAMALRIGGRHTGLETANEPKDWVELRK